MNFFRNFFFNEFFRLTTFIYFLIFQFFLQFELEILGFGYMAIWGNFLFGIQRFLGVGDVEIWRFGNYEITGFVTFKIQNLFRKHNENCRKFWRIPDVRALISHCALSFSKFNFFYQKTQIFKNSHPFSKFHFFPVFTK